MICGLLLLDKQEGLSSNAALQRVRRLSGADKAGHVGSLDPLATGMLPICLGEATKVASEMIGGRKRYRFTVALGAATATGDREGEIVERAAVPRLDPADIEAALARFRGRVRQVPPMYSALKHQGQPLYRLARAGVEVERPPREIEIAELTLRQREAAAFELEALCSKGTYVRVLAQDIARALGSCGHVSALRRLYVEPFAESDLISLESLERQCLRGAPPQLLPPDAGLAHLPAVVLAGPAAERLAHGESVAAPPSAASGGVRIYDAQRRFMGLGEGDGEGRVRPRRLFVEPCEIP